MFCMYPGSGLCSPHGKRTKNQVDFAVKRREWEVLAAADFDKPGVNVACEAMFGGLA